MRYFVAILMLAFALPSMAATYYIDYSSGSDGNSGTSTSAPWKRHPYMAGFAGGYNHAAGDQFIFKGGVTWPVSCFAMGISAGGNANAYDYYGVNKSWYAGSSWTQPIFDGGGPPYTIGQFISVGSASYVIIDNLNMTDFYWVSGYGTSYIGVWANDYIVIQNCWFHGWTHSASGSDDLQVCLGQATANNTGCVISNCVFDGTSSGGNSGTAVYNVPTVKNCIITNMGNGALPNGSPAEVSGCIIGPIYNSYSGVHANAVEQANPTTIYIHHNIMFNLPGGITIFVGNPGTAAYVYDNLIYNSQPIPIQSDGRAGAGTVWAYNNTVISTMTGAATRCVGGSWTLNTENNQWIDSVGVSMGGQVNALDDLYQTSAQAGAAGYVSAKNWQPTSASVPTVGKGANLTSTGLPGITKDILGNARPATGAWDIGAYQWGGTGGGGGNVTSNSPPTVSAITQNAADVDPNTIGLQLYEGTTVQYSGTATDPNGDALTWQWSYTVNGGSSVVFQSGSGTVLPINFTYPTGSAGNTYIWTLSASDGQTNARTQLTVSIESPPVAQAGLSFAATSGIITAPFVSANGYITQPAQTGVSTGGVATYTFSITNAGNYVIQALVNAPSDSQNSFYVNIDAMPTDPNDTWQIPLTSGFQNLVVSWQGTGTYDAPQFVPQVFNLSNGTHQLFFVGREANTQLQSISILKMLQPPQNLRVLPMIVNAPTFPVTQ